MVNYRGVTYCRMNQIVTPCLRDTGMNSPRYGLHCYEILCCNHITNTEKQEGTGVNL